MKNLFYQSSKKPKSESESESESFSSLSTRSDQSSSWRMLGKGAVKHISNSAPNSRIVSPNSPLYYPPPMPAETKEVEISVPELCKSFKDLSVNNSYTSNNIESVQNIPVTDGTGSATNQVSNDINLLDENNNNLQPNTLPEQQENDVAILPSLQIGNTNLPSRNDNNIDRTQHIPVIDENESTTNQASNNTSSSSKNDMSINSSTSNGSTSNRSNYDTLFHVADRASHSSNSHTPPYDPFGGSPSSSLSF